MTFSLNDYLTAIALLIGLTGGVPGIIGFLKDRVKLVIHCYSMSYGFYENQEMGLSKQTFLAVPLTIYNHGNRPLYAVSIQAAIIIRKKKYILTPMKIVVPITVNSTVAEIYGVEQIKTLDPSNDLQSKRFLVTKEVSQGGYVAFLSPDVSTDVLSTKKFWIEFKILDNTEKKHTFRHVFNVQTANTDGRSIANTATG